MPDGLALIVCSGSVLVVPGDFKGIQGAAQLGELLFVRREEVLHLAPLSAKTVKPITDRVSRSNTDRVSRANTGRVSTERGGPVIAKLAAVATVL